MGEVLQYLEEALLVGVDEGMVREWGTTLRPMNLGRWWLWRVQGLCRWRVVRGRDGSWGGKGLSCCGELDDVELIPKMRFLDSALWECLVIK